jgi:PAS domain S-box-containing protein
MTPRTVLVLPAGSTPWADRFHGNGVLRTASAADLQAAELAAAECVLIDGAGDPVIEARRIRETAADVQLVIVAPVERHPPLRREILFASGLGEVWMVTPDEADAGMAEQAGAITRARRVYRQTHQSLEADLGALPAHPARRAMISEAYLAALLHAVPDPVVSADEDGRIVSWNAAAERVLGLPRSQAVGKALMPLIDGRFLGESRTDEYGAVRHQLSFRRADGAAGHGELIEVPVAWRDEGMKAIILHDLTEIRRAQHAIEEQAAELEVQAGELESINDELLRRTADLENALRTRSRFYAAMSHELRTPINAIVGFNALLLEGIFGELTPQQHDRLGRAQRAAQHLLELVNDVLDLAKIEAGRIDVKTLPTTFPDIAAELLDTVSALAEQHDVVLQLHGPQRAVTIDTDPRRVRQILLNLLSNAIRFGAGKPVRVSWQQDDTGAVIVDVVDAGPGLAAADVRRIFDEFEQAGERGAAGGTGLGLPISKRLAGMLGGSLTVESTIGAGSRFTLRLPPLALDQAAGDG